MPSDNLKSKIESLLFVSSGPLKTGKIARSLNVPKDKVVREIDCLEQEYRDRNAGICLIRSGDTVEMGTRPDNFPEVEKLLSLYTDDYLGLCFDSGHANIETNSYEYFEKLKDRLISIHIHDNDGEKDLHQIPYYGTTDWFRVTKILSESSYEKTVSLEVSIHNMKMEEEEFLRKSFSAAEKLSKVIIANGEVYHES